ncbi:MAG: hypothetical protein EAZ57_01480 [Cytophagales bacterium]|nr:MAG: hypothetical protein EAZ67_01795 [Cytophagales bacterium]TAF62122.1 MAG: hypothetical protein EAZ57_01480 [Cytophagales bacterium]
MSTEKSFKDNFTKEQQNILADGARELFVGSSGLLALVVSVCFFSITFFDAAFIFVFSLCMGGALGLSASYLMRMSQLEEKLPPYGVRFIRNIISLFSKVTALRVAMLWFITSQEAITIFIIDVLIFIALKIVLRMYLKAKKV